MAGKNIQDFWGLLGKPCGIIDGMKPQDVRQTLYEFQQGKCAACSAPITLGKGARLDHNHLTWEVRGLLCHSCNVLEGLLDKDLSHQTRPRLEQKRAALLAYRELPPAKQLGMTVSYSV